MKCILVVGSVSSAIKTSSPTPNSTNTRAPVRQGLRCSSVVQNCAAVNSLSHFRPASFPASPKKSSGNIIPGEFTDIHRWFRVRSEELKREEIKDSVSSPCTPSKQHIEAVVNTRNFKSSAIRKPPISDGNRSWL